MTALMPKEGYTCLPVQAAWRQQVVQQCKNHASGQGVITTLGGRKRFLEHINGKSRGICPACI